MSESIPVIPEFVMQVIQILPQETVIGGIFELLKYAIVIAMAVIFTNILHRWELRHKSDNRHVSFSINYIDDRTLKLRPVGREISIAELFPNVVLQKAFIKATKRTTRENPLLEFPLAYESAIMSTLQSYISDDFSDGFLHAAANRDVCTETYIMMAAYEQWEDVPIRKIRVIVTHYNLLQNIPQRDAITLEKTHQAKRLLTMDLINVHYRHMPEERKKNHRIELVFTN